MNPNCVTMKHFGIWASPCGGTLYYIDYECNAYMEEWDFEHWGTQYWNG